MNKLIAKIKIAQKQLEMDNEDYRMLLYKLYKKKSSTELYEYEAKHLLLHFQNELGWKPKQSKKQIADKKNEFKKNTFGVGKNKYSDFDNRRGLASGAQMRFIESLWRDVARDKSDLALRNFIKNKTKISDIVFLTKEDATNIIIALNKMKDALQ